MELQIVSTQASGLRGVHSSNIPTMGVSAAPVIAPATVKQPIVATSG
jgi:hypothetical protein